MPSRVPKRNQWTYALECCNILECSLPLTCWQHKGGGDGAQSPAVHIDFWPHKPMFGALAPCQPWLCRRAPRMLRRPVSGETLQEAPAMLLGVAVVTKEAVAGANPVPTLTADNRVVKTTGGIVSEAAGIRRKGDIQWWAETSPIRPRSSQMQVRVVIQLHLIKMSYRKSYNSWRHLLARYLEDY